MLQNQSHASISTECSDLINSNQDKTQTQNSHACVCVCVCVFAHAHTLREETDAQ